MNCLKNLVDARELEWPALADAVHSHNVTKGRIALAESHWQGGARAPLPMGSRDLYVFHI